jgi:hypothetical protein
MEKRRMRSVAGQSGFSFLLFKERWSFHSSTVMSLGSSLVNISVLSRHPYLLPRRLILEY